MFHKKMQCSCGIFPAGLLYLFCVATLLTMWNVTAASMTTASPLQSTQKVNKSRSTVAPVEEEKCPDGKEKVSPLVGDRICCNKCKPGFGMLKLCTDKQETKCRECKIGTEFSENNSAKEKCNQCTKCQENFGKLAQVKSNCTATRDTICKCIPGAFLSRGLCRECKKCPLGSGVTQLCKFGSDTQCEICPAGFYSNDNSSTSECRQCSKCAPGMVEVQSCSAKYDRVCCPKNDRDCATKNKMINAAPNETNNKKEVWTEYIDRSVLDTNNKNNSTDSDEDEYPPTANEQIPIYCAIMGLVIVGLIIYVVYKHWRQRQSTAAGKLSNSNGGFAGFDPKLGPVCKFGKTEVGGQPLIRVVCNDGQAAQRKNRQSTSPKHDERLLRELPEKHFSKIQASIVEMKNGVGWKELAHELGYAPAEISAFEVNCNTQTDQSENNNDAANSGVHRLFTDWTARDTATVSCLALALERIGRLDTLHLLRPASRKSHSDRYNPPPYPSYHPMIDKDSSRCPLVSSNPTPNAACQEMGHL